MLWWLTSTSPLAMTQSLSFLFSLFFFFSWSIRSQLGWIGDVVKRKMKKKKMNGKKKYRSKFNVTFYHDGKSGKSNWDALAWQIIIITWDPDLSRQWQRRREKEMVLRKYRIQWSIRRMRVESDQNRMKNEILLMDPDANTKTTPEYSLIFLNFYLSLIRSLVRFVDRSLKVKERVCEERNLKIKISKYRQSVTE